MKWCLVGVPLVAARVAALVVALVVARESCSALATGGAQASSQAAQAYRANLPSLECDEAMLSQRVRDGKVRQEVRIKATLREIRDESERGGFRDEYTYNMVNGRQRRGKAALAPVKTPYFVHNVFANSLSIGARPLPACYDYRFDTLDSGRTVQFTVDVKPAARDAACRGIPEGYHKTMLMDAATGVVRHVERSVSIRYAAANLEIPEVVIDYAPEKLGEDTYWLPVRFEANDPTVDGRMIATYSNFHRYTGVAKILP
jgi:hypothetical protein